MPKKLNKKGKPMVHEELKGFDITVNEFGQMESNFNVNKLNGFLNENVEDKKISDEQLDKIEEE